MTPSTNSPSINGTTAIHGTSKADSPIEAKSPCHSIAPAIGGGASDIGGVDGITRLSEENKVLKGQLQAKDGENGRILELHRDLMNKKETEFQVMLSDKENTIQGFIKQSTELEKLQQDHSKLETSFDGVNGMLEESNREKQRAHVEIEDLKEKTKQFRACKEQLRESTVRNTDLEAQLRDLRSELETLYSFQVPPHFNLNSTVDKLKQIWDPLLELMVMYFQVDLGDAIFKDKRLWGRDDICQSEIPLYPSNTVAAKFMRSAWVMSKLARLVNELLLQPCYAFNGSEDFREILTSVAGVDNRMESQLRRTLLKVEEEHHLFNREDRIDDVVGRLLASVKDFIPMVYDEFEADLTERLGGLCSTWSHAQTFNSKVEVAFRTDADPKEDLRFMRHQRLIFRQPPPSTTAAAGKRSADQHLDPSEDGPEVLPVVFIIEHGRPCRLLIPGARIMKSQIEQAVKEKKEVPPMLARRGTHTTKNGDPRRASVHHDK